MKVHSPGSNKMIVMNVEHFTYKGSTNKAVKVEAAKAHEVETQALK